MSAALIPVVFAVAAITHVLLAMPAGALADKIGRAKVLIMGYGLFIVTVLLFSTSIVAPAFIFLLAGIYGAYQGIGETLEKAMVPSFAPSDLRASAYGVYYLVEGVAFFIANAVFGTLWEYVNITTACTYSLILAIIGMVGMIIFFGRGK
jgi:MFS family permease